MNTVKDTYRIPAVNFPRLEKEVGKLNERAEKLETDPVVLTVVDKEEVTRIDDLWGTEYQDVYFICTIEGPTPVLEGYHLVAQIQRVKDSEENIVREVPGHKCPAMFRTTGMDCDHCNAKRRRNSVFIVKNEFGEFVRVGKTCLQDYLGGTSPDSLINRAEYMMSFGEIARNAESEGWGNDSNQVRSASLSQFVIACAVLIRKIGWKSKSEVWDSGGTATAALAWRMCLNPNSMESFVKSEGLKVEPKDIADAKAAIAWAEALDPEKTANNYLHNLGVACRQAYVLHDRAGYVGSVLAAHRNQLNCEAENTIPKGKSKHVGVVGQRTTFENLMIIDDKDMGEGEYGPKHLVTMRDESGNIVKWWANGEQKWVVVGAVVTLTAKVTKHDAFNGERETIINRPSYKKPKVEVAGTVEDTGHNAAKE